MKRNSTIRNSRRQMSRRPMNESAVMRKIEPQIRKAIMESMREANMDKNELNEGLFDFGGAKDETKKSVVATAEKVIAAVQTEGVDAKEIGNIVIAGCAQVIRAYSKNAQENFNKEMQQISASYAETEKQIKAFFAELWKTITDTFEKVQGKAKRSFFSAKSKGIELKDDAIKKLNDLKLSAQSVIAMCVGAIMQKGRDFLSACKSGYTQTINAVNTFYNGAVEKAEDAARMISGAYSTILIGIGSGYSAAKKFVTETAPTKLAKFGQDALKQAETYLKSAVSIIVGLATRVKDLTVDTYHDASQAIIGIVGWFSSVMGKGAEAFNGYCDAMETAIGDAADKFNGMLNSAAEAIQKCGVKSWEKIEEIPAAVLGSVVILGVALYSGIGKAKEAIKSAGTTCINAIKDGYGSLVSSAKGKAVELKQGIGKKGLAMAVNSLKGSMSNDEIVALVNQILQEGGLYPAFDGKYYLKESYMPKKKAKALK